jgi:hypothetical protein
MFDPQNAPEFYTVTIRRMTDADGVEIVLFEDQDGNEFVVDAEEYGQTGRREP